MAPLLSGVQSHRIEDEHFIRRVRRFYRYRRELLSFVSDTLSILASEHATGTLCIDISQGHVACARFEECAALAPSENNPLTS